MNEQPPISTSENTPLAEAYNSALRSHALMLIALGYARMSPANFKAAEEDAITGELTREMQAVIESEFAPEWTGHYSVQEQVRANAPGKLGKDRPIVDIEFERHKHGRRPRLRFEAKRLGPNHRAKGYFGDGGLDAFVTGYYDRTHEDTGMLGYVQSHDEAKWAGKLAKASADRTTQLSIEKQWAEFSGEGFPAFTYSTQHRDRSGKNLNVLHVLLRFVELVQPLPNCGE